MFKFKPLLVALAAAHLLAAAPAVAKERTGVVTAMEPIENRGADETEGTKKKRSMGLAAGNIAGIVGGVKVGGKVGMAAMAAGGRIGREVALVGDDPESTQYMVTVKLDDGKTLNLARYRVNLEGVEVGTRVLVRGKGSEASIEPLGEEGKTAPTE
ncbi:hypothetical protein G6N82_01365 [Altererythrobacter sp. BO-6]|uniref:hypothetical protein n=1 Tax=Altererythrobacter sp. BO-6 TaxID=2604537 RepID=UPI0013E1F303|nr:hypothetical protein [Altererythrobacter sp. BO-6]QIG52992.1 hypothetical protein G6N82_01365 [Altererythrobacter sp. BO-6]